MKTKNQKPVTPGSVLAEVKEMFAESRAATELSRIEFEKRMAESQAAAEKSRADFDKIMKELSQQIGGMANSNVDFDKSVKESRTDFDKRMKELSQQIGGMANSNGAFAEEFFYNALQNSEKNLFGEKYDKIWGSTPGWEEGFTDEYDIVLLNCQSVCIVEVKYKADSADFGKLLRKPVTFRENYPKYKNHKMYIALAGMSFHKRTEKSCRENGIAIIKQVGDTIVINDKNVRAY